MCLPKQLRFIHLSAYVSFTRAQYHFLELFHVLQNRFLGHLFLFQLTHQFLQIRQISRKDRIL